MITAEIFNNSPSMWADIQEKILYLEKEAFGSRSFTQQALEMDFLDSKNIIILLKEEDRKKIIGFTYAKPREPETNDSPANKGETAWVWDTVIEKKHRGKGYLGTMMTSLEEELKRRGFRYLERNALVANNFAKNIDKHYRERIIKKFSLESEWGPQIFFRIKL